MPSNGTECARWTEREETILRTLYLQGKTYSEIAKAIGTRNVTSVVNKLNNYRGVWGLPLRKKGRRKR